MNHILGYFSATAEAGGFRADFEASASACFENETCKVMVSGDFRILADGHRYESVAGASEIAALYQQHGTELFVRSGGNYSLAIFDKRERRLLVAVDGVGFGQVYYQVVASEPASVVFSSSLAQLKKHPGVSASLSRQGLYNYFYFHVVPSPGTIYEGIRKLGPGQLLVADERAAEVKAYRARDYREDTVTGFAALEEECRRIVRDCTARYAGLPDTGCFLSGGIDSSTITAFHAMQSEKPIDTFSIGFDAPEYDESHYAEITATKYATRHHRYDVTPANVLESIERIARAYDEPFGNASAVPAFYCAKLARESGVTHMLAGDGGDEIFAGNERYQKQRIFELYGRLPKLIRGGLVEPVVTRLEGRQRLFAKAASYVRQANTPLPDRLEAYNFLHRESPESIFEADFLAAVNVDEPLGLKRGVYHGAKASTSLNRLLELDMKFTVADNDLRKVITMCELAGVQVHFPLLDDALIDFAASVPSRYKLRGNKLRYFFKQSMRGILHPQTLAKQKHGFGLPFGLWLKDYKPLRDFAGDCLQSFKQRGIVRKSYIDFVWDMHQHRDAVYYGVMIWLIVVLETWLHHHQDAGESHHSSR